MDIVFMGTPAFALPALQELIDSEHNVVAVYTQPPRPAKRGQKTLESPIHQLANVHDIPVYTPETLRSEIDQYQFSKLDADIAVVAAYGLILPSAILEAYPFGCINIHPSDLPRWRGAAPIQRTIMAGDTETAMCIMQMDEGLDTGHILMHEAITIEPDITAGTLHDLLAEKGASLLIDTLEKLNDTDITASPQSDEGVTYAHKLKKEEGLIDWNQPAAIIDAHIRGLSPFPGAYIEYQGDKIKILEAAWQNESVDAAPGTVVSDTLHIACKDGILQPQLVQRAGKKAMRLDEFLRGFTIPKGTIL